MHELIRRSDAFPQQRWRRREGRQERWCFVLIRLARSQESRGGTTLRLWEVGMTDARLPPARRTPVGAKKIQKKGEQQHVLQQVGTSPKVQEQVRFCVSPVPVSRLRAVSLGIPRLRARRNFGLTVVASV